MVNFSKPFFANNRDQLELAESIQNIDLNDERSIKFLCKCVDRRLIKIIDVEEMISDYRKNLASRSDRSKQQNPYLAKLFFDFSTNQKTNDKIYKMLHGIACEHYDKNIKTEKSDKFSSIALLLRFIEGLDIKFDAIIDIGFARGTPDLEYAFKSAFYLAIDPAPENLPWMERFICERDNSELRTCALSDKIGKAFLVSANSATNSELHSTLDSIDQKSNRLVSEVEVDTLDNLLKNYYFEGWAYLKTDTEGNDFKVLKGAKDQLNRIALIQAELRLDDPEHPNSLNKVGSFLMGSNFFFFRAYNYNYNTKGMLRQCDAIFMHHSFIKHVLEKNEPRTPEQIEALELIKIAKREFKAKKQMKAEDLLTRNVS